MSAYERAAHRVQSAIAFLMGRDPDYTAVQPKHLRVGIDLSKSDQAGLAALLMEKGVFTKDEYIAAVTKAAQDEADRYEKAVQAVFGDCHISTR